MRVWVAPGRLVSLGRSALAAWGAYVVCTVASAWPVVVGWPEVPGPALIAACLVVGAVGMWRGRPAWCGCATGCFAAAYLRAAVADDGVGSVAVGFSVATLAMAWASLWVVDDTLDPDGRLPAREAAVVLWLCGCISAGLGVVLADVLGWVVSHA